IPHRNLIIGTAGHIDHGKTVLVKALTGRDTDRLAEEKERGISIDLGFAPLQLSDGSVAGIVDVPGHENFIRNMLAGATGQHVADEVFVTGHVDYSCDRSIGELEGGEPEVDRDSSFLFLGKTVRVSAGERLHQYSLTVVDMTGGSDDEVAVWD